MEDQPLKLRTIEAWDPLKSEWFDIQFRELRKGHVFRMFEDSTKQEPCLDPVEGKPDEKVATWVCICNAYPQEGKAVAGVQVVPVPGF